MSRSRFPKCIQNMILNAYERNLSSAEAAEHINASATAQKLDIEVTPASVASAFAWITIRNNQ